MTQGVIVKLVKTHGSQWGCIRPRHESRQVFFNVASLDEPSAFESIEIGQTVEFDERSDFVTNSHAEHVILTAESPAMKAEA